MNRTHSSTEDSADNRRQADAGGYRMQREHGRVVMTRPGDPHSTSTPKRHGALDDPDYPSPRKLRRTLGFALDVLIHLTIGAAAGFTAAPPTGEIRPVTP